MVGLTVLVLVVGVVVGLAYAASRRSASRPTIGGDIDPSSAIGRSHLEDQRIERWVDAGLLSRAQADAIARFETEQRDVGPERRIPPTIEALAYVGGMLLSIGAAMLVSRFWDSMGTGPHIGVAIGVAALTGIVGSVVGETDPAARRLRGFLWGVSAVGCGAVAGLVVSEAFDRTEEPVAFATATVTAAASMSYWRLRDRPIQHATTFLALVVAIGTGIATIGSGNDSAWIGGAFIAFGAMWAALSWWHRIPPGLIGFPLGIALTLVGAGVTGGRAEWLAPVLGLALATVWITVGIVTNEGIALAPGVFGVFVFLPWAIGYFFGATLGAPVVVMVSGAVLLGVVGLLWRRRRSEQSPGGTWGAHFPTVRHS